MSRIALIIMLLLAFAPPARAAATLTGPAGPLAAGDRVEFTWSGLPVAAEEAELEWSPNGSRWLRLSPELDARDGRYVWRVPRGVTGTVRVRLRAGGEHREWVAAECTLQLEGEANTDPAPGAALPEWWGLDSHERLPVQALFANEPPAFHDLTLPAAVAPHSTPLAVPLAGAMSTDEVTRALLRTRAPSPRTFAAPRSTPLRN